MSYINTTTPTRIWIGGKEYTDWLLSGSVNDESSISSAIAKTSGSIKLGGVHNSLVMQEFPLPIGSEIIVQCTLPNGFSTRHPRGTLYVINSTINYEDQTVDIEVGCSLFFASTYEVSFRPKIKQLFNLIPEPYEVFDVQNYDMSELNSVLESLGYIMYQDKNGKIQCASAFGNTGFGSVSSSSKFTSYDNATAISIQSLSESSALVDPASLIIKMDWGIPLYEPPDPEEEEEAPDDDGGDEDEAGLDKVLSEIQYIKTKTIQIAPLGECLNVYYGKKLRIDDSKIFSCGVALNPEYIAASEEKAAWDANPDFCKQPLSLQEFFSDSEYYYAYEVKGKLATEEVYISDEIQKFQEAEYKGPGKQLNYEKTYETMSVWRIADGAISQWLDNVSREFDLAIEEANAAMQECNEYAQICEENNIWLKTPTQRECLTKKEKKIMEQTFAFYNCLFADRLNSANNLINYALAVRNVAVKGLAFFYGKVATTNINERFITFGKGGEVVSRRETNTIHAGASKFTVDYIKRAGEILESEEPTGVVVDQRTKSNVGNYKFGPDLGIITAERGDIWPLQFLKSETIDTYEFFDKKVKQTSTKIDYENPENNTVDIKISTDNSTAAPAEPRNASAEANNDLDGDGIPNEEDLDRDGDGDPNNTDPEPDDPNVNSDNHLVACNINTESVEREYKILGKPAVPMLGAGWAGYYSPEPEEISMPISFKPIVPEDVQYELEVDGGPPVPEEREELMLTERDCQILTNDFRRIATANVNEYEKYINRYLAVAMAKRLMDNRGIRIVEKMRAEVFGYHPFMPITVVLTANKQTIMARVSSATWAFDSTNAVCSFDCYVMS